VERVNENDDAVARSAGSGMHAVEPEIHRTAMEECLRAQAAREPRGVLASFWGVSPLTPQAAEFYLSALSELETSVTLSALGSRWMVAHPTAASATSGEAHSVVFGPAGVFYVTSNRHPGARLLSVGRMILVNGRRVAHVRDATNAAEKMATSLTAGVLGDALVHPVVVVVGVAELIRTRPHDSVTIVHLGELAPWLLRQPTIHSAREVDFLVRGAAQLGLWQSRPVAADRAVRQMQRFERLRAEVDAANRLRRRWWSAGGVVAIAATVATLVLVVAPAGALLNG